MLWPLRACCGFIFVRNKSTLKHSRSTNTIMTTTTTTTATATAENERDGGGRGGSEGGSSHGIKRSASVFSSVCNLANCAIGAGVLSLPYAMREMGAALGLALAIAVAAGGGRGSGTRDQRRETRDESSVRPHSTL